MAPTLAQVYLMVADLDRSVRFYETALGMSISERGDRSATFETPGGTLQLEEDFDAETLAEFGLTPPGERRGSGAIVVLEVDDADDAHELAEDYGADVLTGPRDVSWGRRLFLVRDPDGYVLEVFHPL